MTDEKQTDRRKAASHGHVTCFYIVISYLLMQRSPTTSTSVWNCLAAGALVLAVFKDVCPITLIAQNYSTSTQETFDIELPDRPARYDKEIYP